MASEQKTVARLSAALDDLEQLSGTGGRADLLSRLTTIRQALESPFVPVVLLGAFKAGKSSLINALVGRPVCPVDADVATAVTTVLRYGDVPEAYVFRSPSVEEINAAQRDTGDKAGIGDDAEALSKESVPLDELTTYVTESPLPPSATPVVLAEIALPADLLRTGIVLVDSPAIGASSAAFASLLLGGMPRTEGVLFLSDADREYCEPELDLLRDLAGMAETVVCVVTKCDLQVHWREIVELDRKHIQALRLDVPLVRTAAPLRGADAVETQPDLESGIPELAQILTSEVLPRALDRLAREASWDAIQVLGSLRAVLLAARESLDPARKELALRRLRDEVDATSQLVSSDAGWRQVIDDGFFDDNSGDEIRGIDQLLEDVPYLTERALTRAKEAVGQHIEATDAKQLERTLGTVVDEILLDSVEWAQRELRARASRRSRPESRRRSSLRPRSSLSICRRSPRSSRQMPPTLRRSRRWPLASHWDGRTRITTRSNR